MSVAMHVLTTLIITYFAIYRSRGWVNISSWMSVDMSYKKVGDGHPLRLWRVSTDVEAPPTELLHRVLRERQLWDPSLLKWRVVTRLEPNAEVFQYLTASMAPIPAKDYCVLRYATISPTQINNIKKAYRR